ncbi:L,D-transpeptidase family protein [Roseibium litorale]|uniref:L,D-transpeptidase family protein n=1 Tax=Roseibium litorale TaxID=2803841 RepID=UPI001AD93560|nr:murein L,D-transpeptidase family protein [Roseibium litorale]
MANWHRPSGRGTAAHGKFLKDFRPSRRIRGAAAAILLAAALAGCQSDEFVASANKAKAPVSASIKRKMTELDMPAQSPIMIRIFKEDSTLEVWKEKRNGRYALLDTFEICKWSGDLGPKIKEGDRQAPEGFYEITPGLMNPNSNYHLAFNMGFPNAYDRSLNRTGTNLMVHGACSSRGCYAMTDKQVQDIYALARDSFAGGQRSFQVQAFPFRMTPENMAKHHDSEHMDFWRMLKTGYDHFEVTQVPPKVSVCEKKYVFDATTLVEGVPFRASAKCPDYKVPEPLERLVAKKQAEDNKAFEQQVARLEARKERERRWAETQSKIASAITGGGDQPQHASLTAPVEAPKTGTATAAAAQSNEAATSTPVETAFAAEQPASSSSSPGSFLKRWLPFGGPDEDNTPSPEVGQISSETPPAAKPQ